MYRTAIGRLSFAVRRFDTYSTPIARRPPSPRAGVVLVLPAGTRAGCCGSVRCVDEYTARNGDQTERSAAIGGRPHVSIWSSLRRTNVNRRRRRQTVRRVAQRKPFFVFLETLYVSNTRTLPVAERKSVQFCPTTSRALCCTRKRVSAERSA